MPSKPTSKTNLARRRVLQLAGLSSLATAAYSYHRGIRFPLLSWEPAALRNGFNYPQLAVNATDLIGIEPQLNNEPQPINKPQREYAFRAYAPEPKIELLPTANQQIILQVNNIATDASLVVLDGKSSQIKETINGITRELTITLNHSQATKLKWQLPTLDDYTFASIGDSGGDKELAWCIQRAHQLGARFLLHLGDFNYQPGDYERSIQLFRDAPLPCYVAIGNHDFHDSGLIYDSFLNQIGPLNNQFSIGKTRFANIDTAASTLPYGAGQRGQLFNKMIANQDDYSDTVVFTHRPLYDPVAGETHDIGSEGERDWLVNMLKQSNSKNLISGHIHIFHQDDFAGIHNIIAGQGLGHQDLITGRDYSKMLIGQVNQDGVVSYDTEPLAMPMELHCHPRVDVVKEALIGSPTHGLVEEVNLACKQGS